MYLEIISTFQLIILAFIFVGLFHQPEEKPIDENVRRAMYS